jgi:glycosyltransferase involved in cell wall biosynthesis
MPKISVVIPVYKAEDCLHELYSRLVKALEIIIAYSDKLLRLSIKLGFIGAFGAFIFGIFDFLEP